MRWRDSGFNTEDCLLMGIHCLGASRQTRSLQENHAMEFIQGSWFWTFEPWAKEGWLSLPTSICCEDSSHSFLVHKASPPIWKDVNYRKNSSLLDNPWWVFRDKISNSFRNSSRSASSWSELEVRFGFEGNIKSPIKWKQCCRIHLLTAFLDGPRLLYLYKNKQIWTIGFTQCSTTRRLPVPQGSLSTDITGL